MGKSDKRIPRRGRCAVMDVQELVTRLESLSLSNDEFHHRQHLEVAFWYLQTKGADAGGHAITRAIEAFAAHLGHAEKFHQTITLFWIRLVAVALASGDRWDSPDALIAANPSLLDKHLPLRFYSRALLFSDEARTGWVDPDIAPLPSVGPAATIS
jgi:hypothetical protein